MAKTKEPEAQQEAEQTATELKISVTALRKSCFALFGVTTSTFDGAAYGMTGEYTVEEMRARINDWLKKEVK